MSTGNGCSAVAERLEAGALAETGPAEAVRLPVELIDPNPNNPRRELVEIEALADNIRTFGLLQPVTVRRHAERYELIGGHRRTAAFRLLREQEPHQVKWRTIPAVVRTADDDLAYLMLLSSQMHTLNWRPREEATALERLVQGGLTLKQIGERLNRTESWASKRLRVYADAVLSGFVQTGAVPTTVAEELLTIGEATTRKEYAQRAAAEKWSQTDARNEVRKLELNRRLREIGRRAHELWALLSDANARDIPPDTARKLWMLYGRIEILAGGRAPRLPTIEAAQRAAGIRSQEPRRQRGRPPKRQPRLKFAN